MIPAATPKVIMHTLGPNAMMRGFYFGSSQVKYTPPIVVPMTINEIFSQNSFNKILNDTFLVYCIIYERYRLTYNLFKYRLINIILKLLIHDL
jgi:hypothetical protein